MKYYWAHQNERIYRTDGFFVWFFSSNKKWMESNFEPGEFNFPLRILNIWTFKRIPNKIAIMATPPREGLKEI